MNEKLKQFILKAGEGARRGFGDGKERELSSKGEEGIKREGMRKGDKGMEREEFGIKEGGNG